MDVQNKFAEEYNDSQQNIEIDNQIIANKKIKNYADIPILKPEKIETNNGSSFRRNNDKSIQSIRAAKYCCEIDASHKSFLRRDRKHLYTEAHHLIPMSVQDEFETLWIHLLILFHYVVIAMIGYTMVQIMIHF